MSETITMRRLKIGDGVRQRKYKQLTIYPVIRLEGNWLQEAGFLPGQSVYLFVQDGKITLKTAPEDPTEAAAIRVFNAFNEVAA